MYSRVQKNALKTGLITCRSVADHLPITCRSVADQKAGFFRADVRTSRRLVNGVSFLLHFVGLGCRFCHISTWTDSATVWVLCADLQISVSYETPGGN